MSTVRKLIAVSALTWVVCGHQAIAQVAARHFVIYDGHKYPSEQLDRAMRSPYWQAPPKSLSNGRYQIARASDGHYYVAGAVNGFPVVFMIDTGATATSVPEGLARNVGIRAAEQVSVETANGKSLATKSLGNTLSIGGYTFDDAQIHMVKNLDRPLLGMDVLNQFSITFADGNMVLNP